MTEPITAGNKGARVRGDCLVTFIPDENKQIKIRVESRVGALFGKIIRSVAHQVLTCFGMEKGEILIEDAGALDFVIAARVEACIKQATDTDKNFLPEMLPENCYGSTKKQLRMSRLYLPGNTPNMMINAGIHHPHAVILDLEDAVAPAKKDEARLLVRNALRRVDFYGAERMVRINQLPLGLADLDQIIPHNVHVVLVPKCESSKEILQVNERISQIRESQPSENQVFLMPIIESAKGVLNAEKIAGCAKNIAAMAMGLKIIPLIWASNGQPRARSPNMPAVTW